MNKMSTHTVFSVFCIAQTIAWSVFCVSYAASRATVSKTTEHWLEKYIVKPLEEGSKKLQIKKMSSKLEHEKMILKELIIEALASFNTSEKRLLKKISPKVRRVFVVQPASYRQESVKKDTNDISKGDVHDTK